MNANATEQYIAAVQRIEQRAQRRAGDVWRQHRQALGDFIGEAYINPQSWVSAQIKRTAEQMHLFEVDQGIYDAAARLVARQLGQAPTTWQNRLEYDAWATAATGIFLGEITRLQLAGADDAAMRARLITGKDGRSSAWELARTSLALAVAMLVWGAANGTVVRLGRAASERDGVEYQKQAIAALDARTTRICRAVNRQIRPLDKPFETLAGPIMNPPFHYNCRTAVVLYHPSFED